MNPSHYRRGWHCTSTIGSVGAAAAAARILGLDVDSAMNSLAIAASQASGLKANFGTMTKPLHVGLAARNGVQAALLAGRGFTASERGRRDGFFSAFDGERRIHRRFERSQRWAIVNTGFP